MEFVEAIILGLVQGLTEFVPVSSSGHLILVDNLFNFEVGNFRFDALLNIGTVAALIVYFRKELLDILRNIRKEGKVELYKIMIATVPAVIAGVLLEPVVETTFRSNYVVVTMLVLVALLMLVVESFPQQRKSVEPSYAQSLIIGIAQTLALIPGTSRSGITIVTGMFSGISRHMAARFSFLISIPVLSGGVAKVLLEGETITYAKDNWMLIGIGILTAFISGYIAVAALLRYLSSHSLKLFAWYRLIIAAIIVAVTLLQ